MIKFLFIFFLSIFQDNYVRIGTIIGALLGFWNPYTINNNSSIINLFVFGFIGWGIGAYLASFSRVKGNTSKRIVSFFKNGKR